jgi:TPP-dependent 2-oxoacid decarboxylase
LRRFASPLHNAALPDPAIAYQEIASWRYTGLPCALGCDSGFNRAGNDELDFAMQRIAYFGRQV